MVAPMDTVGAETVDAERPSVLVSIQHRTKLRRPYSLQNTFRSDFIFRGATAEEAEVLARELGDITFERYDRTWNRLVPALLQTCWASEPTDFTQWERIPLFKLAVAMASLARQRSMAEGRNMYSALLLFPCFQAFCFERELVPVKRLCDAAQPKYHWFYGVATLLGMLAKQQPVGEEQARLSCILLLRFLAVFRGCDLAAASRGLRMSAQPWFLNSKRKGRQYLGSYRVHAIKPVGLCPQQAILRYSKLLQDYTSNRLFVSLTRPRRPLSADGINSITTKFLKDNGIQDFTVYSTCGAAASALIALGVEPHLVCALGDWQSYHCFLKCYDRVTVLRLIGQAMIPSHLAAVGGGPSMGLVLRGS